MTQILTLHSAETSGGAIAQIVLELSGLPYEIQLISWERLRSSPEYERINPDGSTTRPHETSSARRPMPSVKRYGATSSALRRQMDLGF